MFEEKASDKSQEKAETLGAMLVRCYEAAMGETDDGFGVLMVGDRGIVIGVDLSNHNLPLSLRVELQKIRIAIAAAKAERDRL